MDVENTTVPDSPAPAPTRWQVAVHEATHAAYAHLEGVAVSGVTVEGIVAVGDGAESEGGMSLGRCYPDWDGESEGAQIGLLGCALFLVGPTAAHKAGWHEDLLLPYQDFLRVAEECHPESDAGCVIARLKLADAPEALYEEARKEARAFVEEHMPEILEVAERLMEKDTIGASEISEVLGPGWYEFRYMLGEMAREDDLAPWVKHAMETYGVDDPGRIGVGADGGPILPDW